MKYKTFALYLCQQQFNNTFFYLLNFTIMNYVSTFSINRVSKECVNVNLVCKGGNSYNASVRGDYDLRDKCSREFAAYDAVSLLNDRGHFIEFSFSIQ